MSPTRSGLDITPQPGLRFLGVHEFQPQIDALLKTLEKNIVPEDVNLGGAYEASAVRTVLLHLARRLTSPPPVRRNIRHNIKVSLNVANGFSGVMEKTDIGLNFGGDASKIWQVEDISTSGVIASCPHPEWMGW